MDGFFGMSGDEIYRNFTEAMGGGDLSGAADIARELQDEHEHEAQEIRSLAVLMESAWRGDAGSAAQRGAAPLAVEHEMSAPLLFTDDDLFHRQVGSFDDAKNRVVPVPPAPEKPPGMDILFQPGALPTYQKQLDAHNAASNANIDVMTSYEGASEYNRDNLPTSYGSLTPDSAGVSVAAPQDGGAGPRGGDTGGPGGDSGRPGASSWLPPASAGGGPGSPGAGPSAPPGGGGGWVPSQATTPGGYVPPTPVTPTPGPGTGVPGTGVPVGAGPGGSGGGGLLPVGGFPPGGGFGGAPGGVGSPEAGRGGRGGVGGPGAAGGGPGGGTGGRPGGEGGHGVGGRAGSGPLAGGAAAEAAARGPAGARGAAGAGGVPMGAGAGRGRGAEDEEHQRKTVLEGGDPEDLFGTDEMTAPPVLGEEED